MTECQWCGANVPAPCRFEDDTTDCKTRDMMLDAAYHATRAPYTCFGDCDPLNCCRDIASHRSREACKLASVPQWGSMLQEPKKQVLDPTNTISHPPHYARWAMEPIEFIALNDLPWWLANVIKYTMRYDAKDGTNDLYKARSYLEMKIRQLEGHDRFWEAPVAVERAHQAAHRQERQPMDHPS